MDDADGGAHVGFATLAPHGFVECGDDPVGHARGRGDRRALAHHHEFVAAQAGHGVDLAREVAQALGGLDEQLVTGHVAE